MAFSEITFNDKIQIISRPELPDTEKFMAIDANEIKEVVNNNADEAITQLADIAKGTTKVGDSNKLNGMESGNFVRRFNPTTYFSGNLNDLTEPGNQYFVHSGAQNLPPDAPLGWGSVMVFYTATNYIQQLYVGITGWIYTRYRGGDGVWNDWNRFYMSRYHMIPDEDNTYDVGTAASRMRNIYAGTGTINISDLFMKKYIKSLNDKKILNFIMDLDSVEYTFNAGMRTHFGLLAQQVEWAMNKNNMWSLDFAGLIVSPIYEEFETGEFTEEIVTDESGREIVKKIPVMKKEIVGETYGLRYDEFIAPLIKVVQIQQKEIEEVKNENEEIKARLTRLEKLSIVQ